MTLFRSKDIRIDTFKSQGPGGQHKNTRDTAVRVYHFPTGISAVATEHRSQARNKTLALARLERKLRALRAIPKPRIATRIPDSARRKRLEQKRLHSRKKAFRKDVTAEEP